MAFNNKTDLRRIADFPISVAGAQLPGLFSHNTADAVATVAAAGYFNAAADRLPIGSVILSVTTVTTAPVTTLRTVTANTGTVVTIV